MGHRYRDSSILYLHLDNGKCNKCIHVKKDGATCRAFPNEIPEVILVGKHDHTKPYPGDNGIQFERAEQK